MQTLGSYSTGATRWRKLRGAEPEQAYGDESRRPKRRGYYCAAQDGVSEIRTTYVSKRMVRIKIEMTLCSHNTDLTGIFAEPKFTISIQFWQVVANCGSQSTSSQGHFI